MKPTLKEYKKLLGELEDLYDRRAALEEKITNNLGRSEVTKALQRARIELCFATQALEELMFKDYPETRYYTQNI